MLRFVLSLALLSLPLLGEVNITVTGANLKKAKMALGMPLFIGTEMETPDPPMAKRLREQLASDLELLNLFEMLPESMVQKSEGNSRDHLLPRYEEWNAISATFFLRVGYRYEGAKLVVEALLHDVASKKKLFGTRYQYPANNYTRLAHAISEDVSKTLTGERGLFLSRIAMVCWNPWGKSPDKEIYVVDTDGRNPVKLTSDRTLTLSPSWSSDGKSLTYSQFEFHRIGRTRFKRMALKSHDLTTGTRKVLSAREGMNSGASWMPKTRRIAATMSYTGRPEIYLLDPANPEVLEPLSRNVQWRKVVGDGYQPSTVNLIFDVEPSFSPDGKKVVLSSARSGHPMIYTVDLATKIATQLTFAGTYNASPSWSPKGDKILFAAQRTGEGNFDLYAIDPDGNNLARVTNGEATGRRINSENPSWAPTGRHFAFGNNEGGRYAIYVMSIDGRVKRKVSPADMECKTPSWGPPEG